MKAMALKGGHCLDLFNDERSGNFSFLNLDFDSQCFTPHVVAL